MNQNTNSIKTIIIVVLVLIAGYFIYQNYANRQADQSGRIITNTSSTNPGVAKQPDHVATCTGTASNGSTYSGTWIVYTDGTHSEPCQGIAMNPSSGGTSVKNTSQQY